MGVFIASVSRSGINARFTADVISKGSNAFVTEEPGLRDVGLSPTVAYVARVAFDKPEFVGVVW